MDDSDRIAKRLSRAGIASRRAAERMIAEGRVSVNGKVIDSPALNVGQHDRIEVDGVPLPEAGRPRLWLYHKPPGLVTSEADEKGRKTVFESLPEGMPRVMSVGRLDLNSEGLLLLTNDGGVKRKLELPATGWLRRYRVRLKGRPQDADFEPLRKGIEAEGERFQPMEVQLDRQQGANAWITIGLREGKNREIRRALGVLGFDVSRLIRISFGPFQLGTLKAGEVEELKPRILRDQLGLEAATEGFAEAKPVKRPPRRPGAGAKRTRPDRAESDDAGKAGASRAKPAAGGPARRAGAPVKPGAGSAKGTGPAKPAKARGDRPTGPKPAGSKPAGPRTTAPGRRPGQPPRPPRKG